MDDNGTERQYQFKIISKQLMQERHHGNAAWSVAPNIFEAVKAYLLWNYPKDFLPHKPPYIPDWLPDLQSWYVALSHPNSPYKRELRVSPDEFREWVLALDFSKPFDGDLVDEKLTWAISKSKPKDVDAVAIEESTNER